MLRLTNIKMPNFLQRRRQYRLIHETMLHAGMQRVSVWSFAKPSGKRYSSVTRNHYIGLGPGAASSLPGQFLFNTFSVKQYCQRLRKHRFATALRMALNPTMERYYWLYWRLYEGQIPLRQFEEVFDEDKRFLRWTKVADRLGFLQKYDEHLELTERGAFWIHWMQNQFILRYINTVWRRSIREPFPQGVSI